ncbi:hypothetical protein QYF61_007987 [Mycteria americana]|uniref:Uncharacterized protein n=1 Tax=Mycteria americana TaxID=33587 RepID=A0AAN7PHR0_MYCAM|nr:hypothetical protein QYF61_007987 [Mycteria americana]
MDQLVSAFSLFITMEQQQQWQYQTRKKAEVLSKDDTKQGEPVDALQGRAAIHSGLDRLEEQIPQYKKATDTLKHIQQRATKMLKGLQHLSWRERLQK